MLVIVRSLISRFLIQSQLCRRDWNIFRPLSQNISRLACLISLLTRRAFSRATGDGPPRPPRFVVRYTLPYGLLLGQLHGGTFVFPTILPIFTKFIQNFWHFVLYRFLLLRAFLRFLLLRALLIVLVSGSRHPHPFFKVSSVSLRRR